MAEEEVMAKVYVGNKKADVGDRVILSQFERDRPLTVLEVRPGWQSGGPLIRYLVKDSNGRTQLITDNAIMEVLSGR